jgi:hypothetical protein
MRGVSMHSEAELISARLSRLKDIVDSLEAECEASGAAQQKFAALKIEMDVVRAQLSTLDLTVWSEASARRPCPACAAVAGIGLRDLTIMTGVDHYYCVSCGWIWKDATQTTQT